MANSKKKTNSSKSGAKSTKNTKNSTSSTTKKKNVVEKKNVKKESKKIEEVSGDFNESFSHILILAFCIIVIFAFFYFLSAYISRDSRKEEKKEVEVSQQDIILGRSFNMDAERYYVLYFDTSDEDRLADYSTMITDYDDKDVPLYVVDMNSAFNKKYAADESNKDAKTAAELKINGPTLISFKDKKIENYYEGDTEIKEILSEEVLSE